MPPRMFWGQQSKQVRVEEQRQREEVGGRGTRALGWRLLSQSREVAFPAGAGSEWGP